MHRHAVREQSEFFFKEFCPPVRFLRRKSVAVTVERASTSYSGEFIKNKPGRENLIGV
jgi:hypothetical protein